MNARRTDLLTRLPLLLLEMLEVYEIGTVKLEQVFFKKIITNAQTLWTFLTEEIVKIKIKL